MAIWRAQLHCWCLAIMVKAHEKSSHWYCTTSSVHHNCVLAEWLVNKIIGYIHHKKYKYFIIAQEQRFKTIVQCGWVIPIAR
jgi:hypothetical protein